MKPHRLAMVIGAIVFFSTAGCAGASVEQPVGAGRVLTAAEQRNVDLIERENARLRIQLDELANQLKSTREQLARTEQERKEIRDELLRMKIAQEEAQRARERQAAASPPRKDAAAAAPMEPASGLGDAELKRRLRDLVRELEDLLQKR